MIKKSKLQDFEIVQAKVKVFCEKVWVKGMMGLHEKDEPSLLISLNPLFGRTLFGGHELTTKD